MTLLDSLKNSLLHNSKKQPSPSSSPSKHSQHPQHHQHKDLPKVPPPAVAYQHAHAHGFAPDSAQDAQFAAFQPAPGTKSMQAEFAAANPANPPGQQPAKAPVAAATKTQPQHGGGLSQAQASTSSDNRERAERMVEQERQMRSRMPVYEGLPSNLELLDKMGDGAFSNVYKAVDRLSKRKVAIKCVRKFELNQTQRANILKEVQIMRGLRHQGIVELLGFTESRDHYFLVLELMEGGELFHQIVKLTYFSEDLSRHVILQVAHSIRYLHEEKGVVHRDIKPENLLFDPIPIIPSKVQRARPYDEEKEDEGEFVPGVGGGGIGVVKLADFGLSKIVWNEETMTPCGTVGYTAPEIVKDERYSKSVDMWALGCVLYTLLCGFPPFYDESINVLTEKVARGYYTFLSPWWDDISASSKDLITHLLCVDPEKRYTIDEFLAHPWCNEKPAADTLPPKASALRPPVHSMPLDSPLMQDLKMGGRTPMKSPGLNSLREAFDITYAVHRMEEEGQRRKAAGGRGFLQSLNEEDSDEMDDLEKTKRKYGEGVAQVLQQQVAQAQAAAAAGKAPQQATGHYQGWGGADRKMAEAALYDGRAGSRDRGRGRKAPFELSLDNATLLGRRGKIGPSSLNQTLAQA